MKLEATPLYRAGSDDNLIPMINVVFLLLIFFMVAGTLRASDPLTLDPLQSSVQQPLDNPVNLFLGADGNLVLDGESISIVSLPAAIKSAASSQALDEPRSLVLKADAQTTLQDMRTVLTALRNADVQQVELVTSWTP